MSMMSAFKSAPMPQERRMNDRVDVLQHATFVEQRTGAVLPVVNLGYSGMLIANAPPGGELPGGEIYGTLNVFDLTAPANGHVVRASAEGLGVLFDNADGDLLQNLRLVMDPARYGGTMVAMNKSYVAEAYRGNDWLVCQGLGPTCLTARFSGPQLAVVSEFSITIRPGGYHVIEYRDGIFSTGVMKEGVADYKSVVFDARSSEQRLALRRAAGVLLGMAGLAVGPQVAPLVTVLKAALEACRESRAAVVPRRA